MQKLTIKDVGLSGKRVFIRVDFNVPLDDKGVITDDTRIKAALPTISYALEHKAKVILASHLGRPDGKVVEKLRMDAVAQRLQELLGVKVKKLNDCIGPEVEKFVAGMKERDIVVLENLRFHKEEEKNDPAFAKALAKLADVYVNDAFGTAHRAHASTEGMTHYLTSCAGFLLQKEIVYLTKVLKDPARPFITILGGAKVSDKIGVIDNLVDKVEAVLIGGAMAYTFLKALGKNVGNSKIEKDKIDVAKAIVKKFSEKKVKLELPQDHYAVKSLDGKEKPKLINAVDIPDGYIGVDIGPKTSEYFKNALSNAKQVLWNGPLGIIENDLYARGSREVGEFIAGLGAMTIIGGGDTAYAVEKFGLKDRMTHVSTGGGASLEFLEGKKLPGIEALTDKPKQ